MQLALGLNVNFMIKELKETLAKLKSFDALKILAGLGSSYLVYKTLHIYWRNRKYKHFPGPPTEGYNN
jgi:hypothetical protein